MDSLVVQAPAKINLGLHVLLKRKDGFHDIETCMVAVEWYDQLTFDPSDAIEFTCSDPKLPTDESNLVVKAALALRDRTNHEGGARIHLEKRIPYAAGLGGGSSDAAATLIALVQLWELNVEPETLHEIAGQLGSDIPFFLQSRPAMSSGRGGVLDVLPIPADGFSFDHEIVIVAGGEGISTADAYGSVTPNDNDRGDIRSLILNGQVQEWDGALQNDFQTVAYRRQPDLQDRHELLKTAGASYVSLSGSGSAIYGIFESEDTAEQAHRTARSLGHIAWRGKAITGSGSASLRLRISM